MNTKLFAFGTAFMIFVTLTGAAPAENQAHGTLVFDVKNYVSQVKIKKKVAKQLKHGGLAWGMVGNVLVIPMINRTYVKPEIPHATRWGEHKLLELKPGEYKITCIGYEHKKTSTDVDKVLSKSAYFNEAVMTFHVLAGKITTLEILPTIKKQKTFLTQVFIPDLTVKVIEDGVEQTEAVINLRMSSSIPWDDYSGPLKF